jgi:hypothetical protein
MIADSRAINEQSMQVLQQMMEQVVGDGDEKSGKPHEMSRKESAESAQRATRVAQRSAG